MHTDSEHALNRLTGLMAREPYGSRYSRYDTLQHSFYITHFGRANQLVLAKCQQNIRQYTMR